MVKSTGQNRSMILQQMRETPQLNEEQTYQAKLRAAAAGGISESDVQEIVAGITKRAKDGDRHAIDQFFRHLLGVNRVPTSVTNNLIVEDVETLARVAKLANQRRDAIE
jgi:hypothetical protein